ncbi:MAG: hypothetical protein SVM86_00970 [Candidatus Cloacimonadota bacterium]|nr:hypothetical protein [Candidatus Cloacimonadota bacterium]
MKFAFGQTHRQVAEIEKLEKPEKSTDQIDFESMERFTLGIIVDPLAAFRFESQFINQTHNEDKYLNPITLTESFGAAKIIYSQDKTKLPTRLGIAFKQNLNFHDDIDNTDDGGLEFVAEYKTPLSNKRIKYNSRLNLYQALYYSEEDTVDNDDWKAIDVDWENTFNASVSEFIMVNLSAQLIYDK